MIAPITIEKVFDTGRIEEVIGDYVELKRSGSNYKGLSPFNSERTPSFMVSPSKQIWKDFSSGKGGNMVTFLMEYEHMSYPESIRHIANKYNIEIVETTPSATEGFKHELRESLYIVTEFAKKHYQQNLSTTEEGKSIALTYLHHRGLRNDTIETFQLGYALKTSSDLTHTATKQGHQADFLIQSGLTIETEQNTTYDRFRERVMFPILSLSGKTLGFGGRTLSNQTNLAKYINSPETLIYEKSKVLYGIFQAKSHIAKENSCLVVEGYTDVIQMHQTGIKHVVALSGTALTMEQIRLVKRFTKNITLLFDGDSAGLNAASRGTDLCLEEDMNLKVCVLPKGEDPDSFAKANTLDGVKNYLKDFSKDFIQFRASLLADESSPIEKSEAIHSIVSSIEKVPNPVKQELYLRECAAIMDISERVLYTVLQKIVEDKTQNADKKKSKQNKPLEIVASEKPKAISRSYVLERQIIQILMLYGHLEEVFIDYVATQDENGNQVLKAVTRPLKVFEKIYLDLQQDEISFSTEHFKTLYETIISTFNQQGTIIPQNIISEADPEQAKLVSELIMEDEKYTLEDWEVKNVTVVPKEKRISQLVTETILNLRSYLIREIIEQGAEQIKEQKESHHQETLEEIKDYLYLKKQISEKLNRVIDKTNEFHQS